MCTQLSTNHPIDLCRYRVIICFSERIILIKSGRQAKGKTDLTNAIKIAIIIIRGGGSGLIMGRKAFQGLVN
ncbi:MAG: hypothetical protein EAZ15_02605 [Sphingobacteriales bacterium]|nr:MAG: hypothetical protein EAZ15_02605 [Sphingobacteriales bacterium]